MMFTTDKMDFKVFFRNPYNVFGLMFLMFFIFAFVFADTAEIAKGLKVIVQSPDILVTDYIEIAGIGAAFVNAGLVGLMSIGILIAVKHEPKGDTIMAIWLIAGFAFFGKNPVNILPILAGGFLFAAFVREPFHKSVVAVLLGTTLSPAVSQMSYIDLPQPWMGRLLGLVLGLVIGFVIEPIAKNAFRSHEGYNLYNVGFAAGILGVVIMALFRNVGIDFTPMSIWSSGNNLPITVFVLCISAYLIIVGAYCMYDPNRTLWEILKMNTIGNDFYMEMKEHSYINMGVLGIFSVALVLALGGEISGPVLGGIFTISGFGCYGKRLQNIMPIILGAMLAGFLNVRDMNAPNVIIAILFSTCLAPITERFGWKWAVVAGLLHLNVSLGIAVLHGGLNLYNNGLAGGFVVMILVPLIRAVEERKKTEEV